MPGPYDINEATIPLAGPHTNEATSIAGNYGQGATGARPTLGSYQFGTYYDTTLAKRIYWDGRTGKWRDVQGYVR
jgi:hypothetical protein